MAYMHHRLPICLNILCRLPYYGNLEDDAVFTQLVDDVCKCVELNPVEWIGVKLDREEVKKCCKENSLMSIFATIYAYAAEQKGCHEEWMCKCLGYINYFDDFEHYFSSRIKYIYIYRDGRDVALSFTKAIAGQKNHYFLAKEWARTQRLVLVLKSQLPDERFCPVKYEDLITDPETVCSRIAEFIGMPYSSKMLDYHKCSSAQLAAKSSKLWGNITKPLITKNMNKFLRESTEDEFRIFESVAGDMLDALSYERFFCKAGQETSFSEEEINEFERINNERKEAVICKQNPDDIKRREIQQNHVDSVKERLDCISVKYHGNMLRFDSSRLQATASQGAY
jgi:hypothetical protein